MRYDWRYTKCLAKSGSLKDSYAMLKNRMMNNRFHDPYCIEDSVMKRKSTPKTLSLAISRVTFTAMKII